LSVGNPISGAMMIPPVTLSMARYAPLTVVDEGYVIATVLSILQPPCEGPRPARTQGGVS